MDDLDVHAVVVEARALFRRFPRPQDSTEYAALHRRMEDAEIKLNQHLLLTPNDKGAWALWRELRRYLGRRGADPTPGEPR